MGFSTEKSNWFQEKTIENNRAIPHCDAVSDLHIPHNLDLITNGLVRAA
jgi:hypothetical protein